MAEACCSCAATECALWADTSAQGDLGGAAIWHIHLLEWSIRRRRSMPISHSLIGRQLLPGFRSETASLLSFVCGLWRRLFLPRARSCGIVIGRLCDTKVEGALNAPPLLRLMACAGTVGSACCLTIGDRGSGTAILLGLRFRTWQGARLAGRELGAPSTASQPFFIGSELAAAINAAGLFGASVFQQSFDRPAYALLGLSIASDT